MNAPWPSDEKYAGALPTWLSPTQVIVLPISERHVEYAKAVADKLKGNKIRCELMTEARRSATRSRSAQVEKIPYMLVVGDKEAESSTVSVRSRSAGDLGSMDLNEFLGKIKEEIDSKAR